ncbi:MAG TPA: hypothetical protein VKJ01_01075 [Candidatus Solibacter sp.]|nr:hypothetical protein [Candidatus Solibacter sp.]
MQSQFQHRRSRLLLKRFLLFPPRQCIVPNLTQTAATPNSASITAMRLGSWSACRSNFTPSTAVREGIEVQPVPIAERGNQK